MGNYYDLKVEENKKYDSIDNDFESFIEQLLKSDAVYDVDEIRKAYCIAKFWHQGVCRKSGEFYLYHPFEVCKKIATDGFADLNILIAALLHDTVEDTEYTLERIEEDFNKKVRKYVEAVTKIEATLDPTDGITKRFAQFATDEHMLQLIKEYPFSVYIKFADRWHNLRNCAKMSRESIKKNVAHTKSILIPLARKLGCNFIADELMNACFLAEEPDIYANIKTQQKQYFDNASKNLQKTLQLIKNTAKDFAEVNSEFNAPFPYQIVDEIKKIARSDNKNLVSARNISYLNFRRTDLYSAYSYKPHMIAFFRIFNPTQQSYPQQFTKICQNLISNNQIYIVNEENSCPIESAKVSYIDIEDQYYNRLRIVLVANDDFWKFKNAIAIHKSIPSSTAELSQSKLKVYTKDGEPFFVPTNSTALDFAFILNEEIGLRFAQAIVNGKNVELDYKLQPEDHINIIHGNETTAKLNWFNCLETPQARSKLVSYFEQKLGPII